ncbi:hypothetical protein HHI36_019273 [Cryptolaemus montrouzieri]|uniref:LIM zinc-binding domain-containing protein n=1 Tax=Cryptolaemus montrouzieri TaxID=559131 RepID=A0ABD2P2Y5_9CUCU
MSGLTHNSTPPSLISSRRSHKRMCQTRVQSLKEKFEGISSSTSTNQNSMGTFGDDSLFVLNPFFLSTKPSECSLETVEHQENMIRANNKIVSNFYIPNKISANSISVKEYSTKPTETISLNSNITHVKTAETTSYPAFQLVETTRYFGDTSSKMVSSKTTLVGVNVTNPPETSTILNYRGNFNFNFRSQLVQKHCLLRKPSKCSFRQKVEIQEIKMESCTSFKDCLSETSLWIKIMDEASHMVHFQPSKNTLTVIAKVSRSSTPTKKRHITDRRVNAKRRTSKNVQLKFSWNPNMCDVEERDSIDPEQVFCRVSNWIESNDFEEDVSEATEKPEPIETNIEEGFSDITSITKCLEGKSMKRVKKIVVGEVPQTEKQENHEQTKIRSEKNMMSNLGKLPQLSQLKNNEKAESPDNPFSVIMEAQESELPESKNTAISFKTLLKDSTAIITSNNVTSRPSSRHNKRHVEGILANKSANIERKTRKRKTLDKNSSVEYDNKLPSLVRGNTDEDFAAKIKSIEEGWNGRQLAEKKPKDLMRKIGKIERSDWNIKEIEKKIKENKMGKPIVRDKEKVPKWSREQFVARQTKLEKLDRQDSTEAKYADIDKNIKHLELKLKEGTNRDLGQNKVATITEKLTSKIPEQPEPVIPKNVDKPVMMPSYSGSEFCHFCKKRVYLMERLSAEGRFFHHGCFKCQYCKAQLRLGSYAFDKDGIYGHKFFCLHHYGMQGEAPSAAKVSRKPSQRGSKPTAKKVLSGVSGVDLLDRVRTPERVEFSNLSRGSSDQEDSLSQMDEDEWTDRNFGASTAEVGSSDDDESSSYSDTDSDDEEAYEEALEEPATKEGTMKWAERMNKRHYSKQHKSDSDPYGSTDSSSYYENSSDDDDSDTATEGEEEIRARELRLQEVRVEPPILQADTGTDTEVKCILETSDILNLTYESQRTSDQDSSKRSSSNSLNFDSALEDNLDINFNNISTKSEMNSTLTTLESGDDSANVSTVSKATVIETKPDKKEDKSDTLIGIDSNETNEPLGDNAETKDNAIVVENNVQSEISNVESKSTTMSKTFFGGEFVPKFQSPEPEPLLVIKRTPSKLNLPKEVGKPKVAVNTNIDNARKYFGAPQMKPLRRSSTLKSLPKPKLTKQISLCEKRPEKLKNQSSFNFEPLDDDLKNIDEYIENLLKNEDELMKPIDPDKYKIVDTVETREDKGKSDSIDDLLEALEMETCEDEFEPSGIKRTDEKIGNLLKWLDEVDYQEEPAETHSIINDGIGKYENLEQILKVSKDSAPVSKLAKNNIKYFDELLSGKSFDLDETKKTNLLRSKTEIDFDKPKVDLETIKRGSLKRVLKKFESIDNGNSDYLSEETSNSDDEKKDEKRKPSLTRSKTEIYFNKPRSSVDLDAVSKVDIKKVLRKFESVDKDKPALPVVRRSSTFKSLKKSPDMNDKIDSQEKPRVDRKKTKLDNFQQSLKFGKKDENVSTNNEFEEVIFNTEVKVSHELYPIEVRDFSDENSDNNLRNQLNLEGSLTNIENKNTDLKNTSSSENNNNLENQLNLEASFANIYVNSNTNTDQKNTSSNESINNNINNQLKLEESLTSVSVENDNTNTDYKNTTETLKHPFEAAAEDLCSIPDIIRNEAAKIEVNTLIENDKAPQIEIDVLDDQNVIGECSEIEAIAEGNLSNNTIGSEEKTEDVLDKIQNELEHIIGSLENQTEVELSENSYCSNLPVYSRQDESFGNNLNSVENKGDVNEKNENLSEEISLLNDENECVNAVNTNSEKSVSNVDNSGAPPVPVRTKHSGKETPPPQRPQRKRSLEQRNKEFTDRTRYVPKEEKLKNLEKYKREVITKHELPKVQKVTVKNLNPESKDKECSIQQITQNLGDVLVNNHVQAMVEEVLSDDNSSDVSSEIQNSATEISTDSEFAQDDPTPTSEIPAIFLNDLYVNMTRGSSSNRPKKIQVTSGFLQKPSNGKAPKQDIELKLTPLVSPAPSLRKITPSIKPPTEPYALNRTQSTGGIATKVSLELKKRYLLGESMGSGSIQKSGSASTLDTKLKSFCSNISDCQKLLKPAAEISASMQTFCNKLDEHTSPILSPLVAKSFNKQFSSETKKIEDDKTQVLPPPDLINVTVSEKTEEKTEEVFENETEGRPRSPLHETSLIVPDIDWKKVGQSTQSLSSSSSSSTSSSSDEQINTPNISHKNIPTVEIFKPDEIHSDTKQSWDNNSVVSDSVKSISGDKKQLNQPKTLPGLRSDTLNSSKKKPKDSGYKKISPQDDRSSCCSSPVSVGEEFTNAFTETELSDWARDGGVSDDLEGVAFDLNMEDDNQYKVCDVGHVCGKIDGEKENNKEPLSANFDSIEYMDTCTESNSEEGVVDSIGYHLFKNEDIAEDSLNPVIDEIVEATNTEIAEPKIKNSGYCIIGSDNNNFGGKVITLKPSDIEQLKQNQNLSEREEDSLVVIETTTEENTCSDSTVKNVTEIPKDTRKLSGNIQKQRLEDKLSQLKKEKEETLLKARIEKENEQKETENQEKNVEFDEHCQRLQSKVDFGNVKDSIDIRKSRRKSKDSPQKSDLIQEEKGFFGSNNSLKDITLNLTPTIKTPELIYKKEVIEKERDVNQRLVQEMVMSKMRAENRGFERKIRNRPNSNKPFQLSKSATTDIAKINMTNLENKPVNGILKQTCSNFVLKEKELVLETGALQKSLTSPNIPEVLCDLHTPIAPPRTKDLRNTEKLRNEARARAKMLSNEELGLSPEDKIQKLREKTRRYERSVSTDISEFQLYPAAGNPFNSDETVRRKNISQRPVSEYTPNTGTNRKSFDSVTGRRDEKKLCRSDSNLLDMNADKIKTKVDSPKKG